MNIQALIEQTNQYVANQSEEMILEKSYQDGLIWVDGVEVTPHFRFITTTRKIEIKS